MNKGLFRLLLGLWLFALVVGLAGLIMKFFTGELLAGYGSYVPWGLWVSLYFHFVGIAGGVFAVGALGYILNIKGFRESFRVVIVISALAVVSGLFSIWLDLGQGGKAYRILLSPNFGSMMAFNAWMYVVFCLTLSAIFFLTFRRQSQTDLNDRSRWLLPLMALAFVFSIAFPSQSGAFFGVVDAKSFWSSPLLPLLFLTSAITAGAAVLLLVYTLLHFREFEIDAQPFKMLRYTTIGGMVFYFVCEFAEYSLAFWSPISHIREAVSLVLFGPFWWMFWIIHLGGAALALVLLVRGRTFPIVGAGALIVAVTFLSARLNILIPGQAVSELKGLQEAFYHFRLRYDYTPTVNEYMVAVFVCAFSIGLGYLAVKLLSRYTQKKLGTSA